MRYRSKPTEVEAKQWKSDGYPSSPSLRQAAEKIVAWVNANGGHARYEHEGVPCWYCDDCDNPLVPSIVVGTADGERFMRLGDYAVRNNGAWSVRERDTFEQRWEPVA